jgi:hypothetical protein
MFPQGPPATAGRFVPQETLRRFKDRIRRKHAEFLVREHVPVECIASLIVLDAERKQEMEGLVRDGGLSIKVIVDVKRKWFFAG